MRFHKFIQDGEGWETVRSETKYASPHIEVAEVLVRTPSAGEVRPWTVAHRKGAVVVVPVREDGRILLVRQERIPIRAAIWELPAGQIEEATEQNETLLRENALREMREETGYELAENGELIPMGYFFPSAGFTDEHSHLFLAKPVIESAAGQSHDENEVITECRAFTFDELRQMIAEGEIRDANTLSAFARITALGLL